MIDGEREVVPHTVQSLLQRKTARLLIEKYIPKFLGKNLHLQGTKNANHRFLKCKHLGDNKNIDLHCLCLKKKKDGGSWGRAL